MKNPTKTPKKALKKATKKKPATAKKWLERFFKELDFNGTLPFRKPSMYVSIELDLPSCMKHLKSNEEALAHVKAALEQGESFCADFNNTKNVAYVRISSAANPEIAFKDDTLDSRLQFLNDLADMGYTTRITNIGGGEGLYLIDLLYLGEPLKQFQGKNRQ
jgi:hypothetical protein